MASKNLDPKGRIEAALYASGRPLSLNELIKASGITSKRKVLAIIKDLIKRTSSTFSAIEIAELNNERFVLQLKPDYTRIARRFATRPLLPNSVLRTLAYIVYFQPISASELAERRGSQAYRHLKVLEEIGFVKAEERERGKVYRTTRTFAEYFGLSDEPEVMKRQLRKFGIRKPIR